MSNAEDAIERLTVWIRDYGHEKQEAFICDLVTVLSLANDAVRDVSNYRAKLEELIDWLESEEDSHSADAEEYYYNCADVACSAALQRAAMCRATIMWIQKNVMECATPAKNEQR